MSKYEEAMKIMDERFGRDSLISVATVKGGRPFVRAVDAYFEDGAFYGTAMGTLTKTLPIPVCCV